ncbi:MAG: diadenylate cyclase CdaA [Candidatus Omnitrophica bacterium]|nr:diadenylate cyclase CdaA [Candidatus Omnitrophota bacterium]
MSFVFWEIVKPLIEIAILWIVLYQILVFFEGTRAFQVFRGIIYLLVAFLLFQILGLDILNWILTKLFAISIIALVIIFQQELRHGLARLGQQHLFNFGLEESEIIAIIEEITTAAYKLSRQKTGCLIAMERNTKLNAYIESGMVIDAHISSELIQSIFNPHSPLHDGGLITRGNRIVAVSCLFPLSDNPNFSKIIGTRHRAALGVTEQTDAIAIMVSEETTEISVACDGRFIPIVNRERLVNLLKDLLIVEKKKKKWVFNNHKDQAAS